MKGISIDKKDLFIVTCLGAGMIFLAVILCRTAVRASETAITASEKLCPIYSVEREDGKIAVTFNAAWEGDDTAAILDILEKHAVRSTFFIVGDFARESPESVRQIAARGHEIANHSDAHKLFSQLDTGQLDREISGCAKVLKDLVAEVSNLVRVPSGDYNDRVVKRICELGYYPIQWDVDSLDWKNPGAENMIERVCEKSQSGSILLFHVGAKDTLAALDRILSGLKEKGLQPVTVSELIYKEDYILDFSGRQHKIASKKEETSQ